MQLRTIMQNYVFLHKHNFFLQKVTEFSFQTNLSNQYFSHHEQSGAWPQENVRKTALFPKRMDLFLENIFC